MPNSNQTAIITKKIISLLKENTLTDAAKAHQISELIDSCDECLSYRIEGEEPLIISTAKLGNLKLFQLIHKKNPDQINLVDSAGRSSLSWASQCGHLSLIDYLLQHPADINLKDKEGKTAENYWPVSSRELNPFTKLAKELCLLAKNDTSLSPERKKLLLTLILDRNPKLLSWPIHNHEYIKSFMALALLCDAPDIINPLINHPQWPQFAQIRDNDGYNLLHLMAFKNVHSAYKHLKPLLDINEVVDNGNPRANKPSALMIAAKFGHIYFCKLLLQDGAIIDLQNPFGNTALTIASKYRQKEVCLMLLRYGADITIVTKEGKTAETLWPSQSKVTNPFAQFSRASLLKEKKTKVLALLYEQIGSCTPVDGVTAEQNETLIDLSLKINQAEFAQEDDLTQTPEDLLKQTLDEWENSKRTIPFGESLQFFSTTNNLSNPIIEEVLMNIKKEINPQYMPDSENDYVVISIEQSNS